MKDYTKRPLRPINLGGAELMYPPGHGNGVNPEETEPGFVDCLNGYLAPDVTFLDIGAYFGSYVCLAAPIVKEVIAFEPHADIRAVLLKTIERNEFKNVTLVIKPLFSRVVKGRMGRRNNFQIHPDGPMETITLDSMRVVPNIIKLDVEGAEYDVLLGGEQMIKKHMPPILVEIHGRKIERFGYTAEQTRLLLTGWGYRLTDVGRRNESQFVIAEAQ